MGDEPVEEGAAGFELRDGNVLVGLVRLLDRARADGRRCASVCALAWLGGVERFIGTDGRIRFHAASDSASDRESGVTNTVLGTYLAKVGQPYEA
jgi:hypothetical protein